MAALSLLVLSVAYGLIVDGTEYRLRGKATLIGRHRSCKVQIDHESVSRKHARIATGSGAPVIIDLDSPNGVYVNDVRIVKEQELTSGDAIRIGNQEMQFVMVAGTDAPPPTPRSSIPDDEDVLAGGDLTAVNDAMALVCTTARRLLDAGELEAAELTLRNRWENIMSRSHAVHPAMAIFAARTAFRMATAMKNARWADDAALIMASADKAPNEETLDDILNAVAAVGMTSAISTYLDAVQRTHDALPEPARDKLALLLAQR